MHIFLKAEPNIGKTTIIERIIEAIPDVKLGGFRTYFGDDFGAEEGWNLYMARADAPKAYQESNAVAKYRTGYPGKVYVNRFNALGRSYIDSMKSKANLLIMDECSFVEEEATAFTSAVLKALDEDLPILGSYRSDGQHWTEKIAAHPNVRTMEVTQENRDILADELVAHFKNRFQKIHLGFPEIHLMRHGLPDYTVTDKSPTGQADPPLCDLGRSQTQAIARELSERNFHSIWTSDLKRAKETADLMAEVLGCPVYVDPDLREINVGEWEGLSFAEIREKYPAEYEARGEYPLIYAPPGGESFLDLSKRAVRTYEKIQSREQGRVLLITHRGWLRSLLFAQGDIAEADLLSHAIDYGEIIE